MERKTVNLFDVIFRGTAEYQTRAEKMVAEALATKGADAQVKLPDTAYALPCIYAITGEKITTVGELEHALELGRERVNRTTMLQSALDAGVASIIFCEIIQAIKYLDGNPHEEWVDGSLTDAVVRSFGVALVTQDIPGVAVIIGKPGSGKLAKTLNPSEQGSADLPGWECIDQARTKYINGVNFGLSLWVEIEDVINVISVRSVLPLCRKYRPGREAHESTLVDAYGFCHALTIGQTRLCSGAGAIEMGFPVLLKPISTKYHPAPQSAGSPKTVSTSLEARGIKIKITEIDCPVSVSLPLKGTFVRMTRLNWWKPYKVGNWSTPLIRGY